MVSTPAAYAIPSPDLAVNFFSNAAQLVGLLAAAGGAVIFGGARRRSPRRRERSPLAGWVLGAVSVVLLASLSANLLQWVWADDERNQRLQTNLVRSSKENGKSVGDTSLKTLAFSDQIHHPLAMTNDELLRLIQNPPPEGVNLIDVREPEEREAGRLPGFTHVRYPDLPQLSEKLKLSEKQNVLFCFSGNRSSELCDVLAAQGIPCRFVIGGYEKWVKDGFPVAYTPGHDASEARGLPGYPNDRTLLDTSTVTNMVQEEDAVFVDVRYPGDFALYHLPDAINIPLRKMPTAEMQNTLRSIPHRPVIAPCYDKRSCFYAKILGLRLHRLGYDFRGRYTVPHEYVAPGSRAATALSGAPPGLTAQAFDKVTAAGVAVIRLLDEAFGSLALALLVAVILLRLVVAPFTIKSERDQVVMRALDDEVAGIRTRWKDSPRRYARELRSLYRRHRISPAVNVAGILIQLPAFIVFFAAVDAYATGRSGGFLWFDAAAGSDPFHTLPALIGGLAFLQLWIGAKRKTLAANALRGAACIGLAALTLPLAAAVNFYLVASLGLMLAQSLVIRRVMARRNEARADIVIAPLESADRWPNVGNKAARLALMARAGLPVPAGFVLLPAGMAGADAGSGRRLLDRFWRKLGSGKVAVRSSGANEDGAARSYAGVFDTILNVDRAGLSDAIARVRGSLSNDRAHHYGDDGGEGSIVVQSMVAAQYAGVMFTRHPAQADAMLVELVAGLGDRLVDGTATPESYSFGRVSGAARDGGEPPIDLAPLLALGRRLEALFEKPQDVEWGYADGAVHLLQSRDITALKAPAGAIEREQDRLVGLFRGRAADETVLMQNAYSELLPFATRSSLSLMEMLWAAGGSVEQACQALGIPYEVDDDAPYLVTVLGRLYINKAEHERRFARSAGPLSLFRMARDADAMEERFRAEFLPAFGNEMRVLEALDPARLESGALIALLQRIVGDFVHRHYVEAEVINIAAEQYMSLARRKMERLGLPAATYLGAATDTVVHHGLRLLSRVHENGAAREEFDAFFGHRSLHDYELSEPRYSEMPSSALPKAPVPPAGRTRPPAVENKVASAALERALRYQSLKEEAKHHCLREFAVIRRLLLEIDRRYRLEGGVFHLTLDEIYALESRGLEASRATARDREREMAAFSELPEPPMEIAPADIETLGRAKNRRDAAAGGLVSGTVVAGTPPVRGQARLVNGEGLGTLTEGDILVVRSLGPELVQTFGAISGIVSELGGWLSHAAILAREYDVPTVVGAASAMTAIRDGDYIQLDADGTVTVLSSAAAAE